MTITVTGNHRNRTDMEVGTQTQRSDDMSSISNYDSSTISTLFSSLSTSSSKSSSSDLLGISYTDYASIRSGSYYKLMKNYYAETESSSSTSTSKDSTSTLAKIEDSSDDVKESADVLLEKGTDSVFNKTSVTDESGTTSYGYDKDKIYNAVSDFIDDYNSLIDAADDSNVTGIVNAESALTGMTKANANLLSSIGITIDSDNKLAIDEDTFRSADMETVKSLFNTTGSYGYQVSAQASMMNYYAQNEASKSNTYSSSGTYTYNYATGEIYSSTT